MNETYKQTFWKRIEEQEQKQKTCLHKVWVLGSGVTVYDTPQYFGFWESTEKCENCGAVRWVGENIYKQRVGNGRKIHDKRIKKTRINRSRSESY